MRFLFSFLFIAAHACAIAQINLDYQKPHDDILSLADAEMAPWIRMNSEGTKAVFLYRNQFKSIEELSQDELRLAGLRINPVTNIGSRTRYFNNLKTLDVKTGEEKAVSGLPDNPKIANLQWSHNQKYMAFTHTTNTGVQLWVLNVQTSKARPLTKANLNANMGDPINWGPKDDYILTTMLPNNRGSLVNASSSIPSGPTVSVNDGEKAQNRTYQDLLKNKIDEANFEVLATSEIWKIPLDGEATQWKGADMYRRINISPDGNYIMVTTINRPFSYIVPHYRFPTSYNIYNAQGQIIKNFLEVPLQEELPKGFMATRTGPRNISWRVDKPSTLFWAEAQDGGDPANEVEFRDAIYQLNAPFIGEKKLLIKTKDRFYDMNWGSKNLAICYSYWWNSRNLRTEIFDPSNPTQPVTLFNERNYQDRYSDPGEFVTRKNEFGYDVLDIVDGNLHLLGDGYSDKGIHPFVDAYNIQTGKTERIYHCNLENKLERLSRAINMKKGLVLTRIESKNEFPNYYFRNVRNGTLTPITNFKNPFEAIQDVHKEVIKYTREDGLELSATLYLPVGYDMEKKEKMPMIMWAYPREFKDKGSASQVTSSPNEFTFLWYGSPLYWVNRGYVVLDDAAFPIVGEGDEEPNDSFRKQLVANAKAGIDAVEKMGYIDRNKVAVGGHSYGAFMTANLLSHSNLFAAGIARSGAYNRTLTPFGFQSEERNYWEAPEVYYNMSPFMHADKMKTPLLLIHGEADNNSGTYPMQSERYFNALKGLGATVRLVMLPKESHGYTARESILHMLWEQDTWLEKYVKNKNDNDSSVDSSMDKP